MDALSLDFQLPNRVGPPQRWSGLFGAAPSLLLAQMATRYRGLLVVITPDSPTAQQLLADVPFFAPALPLFSLPDGEVLPYDAFSPAADIISQRLDTLSQLPHARQGLLVVPVSALMQRLPPRYYLDRYGFSLATGAVLDSHAFRQRLEDAGYTAVSQVRERGEFAQRGALIDVFPMGSDVPFRVDLFDDTIDTLRTFDPDSQRTRDTVTQIKLLPAREFPADKDAIARFRTAFRSRFGGDPQRCPVYARLSQGELPSGIEAYLPLFFDDTATVFDYLPTATIVVRLPGVDEALVAFQQQIAERFELLCYDSQRPLLPPPLLYLDAAQVHTHLEKSPNVQLLAADAADGPMQRTFPSQPPPEFGLDIEGLPRAFGAFATPFAAHETEARLLLVVESAGRREVMRERLQKLGFAPTAVADWAAFLAHDSRFCLTVGPLAAGIALPTVQVVVEIQLTGNRARQQRRRTSLQREADSLIRDLTALEVGAPVVHEHYGVGRYLGLEKLEAGGMVGEFVALEYADKAKLYVPVAALHLLGRYTGAGGDHAPLHKLGSDQWAKATKRAAEKARDAAAELLEIYARRAARPGVQIAVDSHDYDAFAQSFPFEETPDQAAAIEAVVADLRRPQPMDRVICGDVGFGKTEVAMRAAFVAVQGGKQVAVLVPTTLLAQQHWQNFRDRFADWPFRIESLSRFRSKKEQDGVIADLALGRVDILVGTHKLLDKSVKFKDLGLVVIDEEHRFGVQQKERFKALRSEVDLLTLTATPIPRTLNMALAGIRDLSIIATPPQQRLAVKTFVTQWEPSVIREACQRELKRGGQIYFLYNDVKTIENMADELRGLLPQVALAVAHGQMPERELEQVMLDFYHKRCQLLLCSTIVESGIDVPNANTIIIHRADKLGLAQLHQLRGRVGRSHHRAYAYLVIPHPKSLTPDAVKRLEAIESIEDLGAGFLLANHDLEIRGAGELLGDEQSGQIQEVGFGLYMELLSRAVKAIKSGQLPSVDAAMDHGPEIDLQLPALIPEEYLPDIQSRLILYKRIANAADEAALTELKAEIIDRFGPLPLATEQLLAVTRLKLQASPLGIRKIDAGPKGARLLFTAKPTINMAKLVGLIQTQPQKYKLDGNDKLRVTADLTAVEVRLKTLRDLLTTLSA